jgi:hypothetical protein
MSQPTTEVVNVINGNEFDEYIGRSDGDSHMNNTPIGEPGWIGNPYRENEYGRQRCIELFRRDFHDRLNEDPEFREAVESLEGKTLACWCDPKDCHGRVIVEYLKEV